MHAIDTQIYLIGDQPMMIEWLESIVNREQDLYVCGVEHGPHKATTEISKLKPDLVILDLDLKGVVGPILIHQIKSRTPAIKILLASSGYDPFLWSLCLQAGAEGVINKTEQASEFINAIDTVLKQNVYACKKVIEILVQLSAHKSHDSVISSIQGLCRRELLVFELLGCGYGPSQIAQVMKISVKTVESYTARIKVKMEIKRNRDLRKYAIRWRNRRNNRSLDHEAVPANARFDSRAVKFDKP